MRAVNLIPSEGRGRGGSSSIASTVPTYVLLGVLAIGVAFVTLYVLTNNKISQRKAQLTTLQSELAQAQAQSERLSNYSQFATLAQTRADAVRGLAATRFDWHAALADLSKVVPANTSLQTLNGSTTGATGSGVTPAAAAASATSSSGPAFEVTGCTKSQDDVARLMTRLRLINGVTSVTLASTQKQAAAQAGAPVSSPVTGAGGASSQGCGPNTPTFDLKVLFQPLPGTPSAGGTTGQAGTATPSTSGGSK